MKSLRNSFRNPLFRNKQGGGGGGGEGSDPNLTAPPPPMEAEAAAASASTNSVPQPPTPADNAKYAGTEHIIAQIRANDPTLTQLSLYKRNLGDRYIEKLADALSHNTQLQTLDVGRNNLTAAGASALAATLRGNESITTLWLRENRIGQLGIDAIADALTVNTTLTGLSLGKNGITSEGAASLASSLAKSNTTLQTLWLYGNDVGDRGCQSLGGMLQANTTLTELYLGGNHITEDGVDALTSSLSTSALRVLELYHNELGDGGAAVIADLLRNNSTLLDLNVRANGLTLQGCNALIDSLGTNSTLRQLDLRNNRLSEEEQSQLLDDVGQLVCFQSEPVAVLVRANQQPRRPSMLSGARQSSGAVPAAKANNKAANKAPKSDNGATAVESTTEGADSQRQQQPAPTPPEAAPRTVVPVGCNRAEERNMTAGAVDDSVRECSSRSGSSVSSSLRTPVPTKRFILRHSSVVIKPKDIAALVDLPTHAEEEKKANDVPRQHHPIAAKAPTPESGAPNGANIDDLAVAEEISSCLERLDETYGTARGFADKTSAVLVMEGWNKMLAFQTMFSEALFARWRIVVSLETMLEGEGETEGSHGERNPDVAKLHAKALDEVEAGTDPIAKALGTRTVHGRQILLGMIDAAVRSTCPHSQTVQREAYRPINEVMEGAPSGFWGMKRFSVDEGTVEEYFKIFARCGVRPVHWVHFCTAYLWCLKTHVPYAEEPDMEDLEKGPMESAHAAFVSTLVAKPAIEAMANLRASFDTPAFQVCVPRFWDRVAKGGDEDTACFIGETFYRQLLTNHPELLDYFANSDMDSLALHVALALDLMIKSIKQIAVSNSSWRGVLDHLNEHHRRLGIPTWTFGTIGAQLLQTLRPFFAEEEEVTKDESVNATAAEMEEAFAALYVELMVMIYHAMLWEEKLLEEAEDFLKSVATELNWSSDKLDRRLLEVKLEVRANLTYAHTSEEIEIGARLAWRNSAKCIGRIAWNTLMVRDCRHVESFDEIIDEVKEHLRIATGGTNIQSTMAVFKPKSTTELWGTRFWSSQYVRYAGYRDEETGEVLGDPGNVEFTEYIIKNNLWVPPEEKTRFDVLPLIVKIPGVRKPYVYQLPKEFVHEVEIEHPDCPAIKKMGLRWAAVPAISNFSMNLGGIDYQAMPFNGWFASVEIARNLFERYKLAEPWAEAMGMSTKTKRIYEQRVYPEMDIAVNYSFKKQGFTMVDMDTVGKSFMVHCKRERDAGRECPGQWSWIGGLTGPTNVTWHHEMRDYYIAPQYEYCCEPWMVTELPEEYRNGNTHMNRIPSEGAIASNGSQEESGIKVPRVLVAFGSETGTAEAAAFQLARALKLCKPIIKPMNEVAGLSIVAERQISHVLILTSTFGTGAFPGNASKFPATEIASGILDDAKVAVLALGSSLYPDFCRAGILTNQQLTKAGAQSMIPLTKVDDATGSNDPISDWINLVSRLVLPPHLQKQLIRRAGAKAAPPIHELGWLESDKKLENSLERFKWTEDESVLCCGNEELIEGGDIESRSTRKITFQLPPGVSYETGDHLAVHPLNSMSMVVRFTKCFEDELVTAASSEDNVFADRDDVETSINQQLQRPFKIDCNEDGDRLPAQLSFATPATLKDVLQARVDLTLHSARVPDVLRSIRRFLCPEGERAFGTEEIIEYHGFDGRFASLCRQLCMHAENVLESKQQQDFVDAFLLTYPTVVDFLEEYSCILCKANASAKKTAPLLSLAEFLPLLPRLQQRHYSISSSPRTDSNKVSISVGVLHVKTSAGVMIHGVCSNYLARMKPGKDRSNVSIRTSAFRGPTSVGSPMILVGGGTGLAPMMGFMQDRAYDVEEKVDGYEEAGECHLFFGCRSEKERIYSESTDRWESSGIISQHLALSREPGVDKQYVQNVIKGAGEELKNLLLRKDTHYYICGDARVGDECFEVCVQCLRIYGHMSRVSAVQHIKKMRAEDRWQYDLWGIISHFKEARRKVKQQKVNKSAAWLKSFE